jgi:hypothetical protein
MSTGDTINAAFEFGGAFALALNVRRLWIDRAVSGVHWGPTVFFTAWGLWNLIYYPSLGQWLSLIGGAAIVVVNTVWLILAVRFGAFRKAG